VRRKSNAAKRADAETRKVLRRRILRVLESIGTYTENDVPKLRYSVHLRVAALVRELENT
jgi:hypothetical protein